MNFRKGLSLILVLISGYVCCGAITTSSYFKSSNRDHAKIILLQAFSSNDVGSVHYSTVGLQRLNEKLPNSVNACNVILKAATDSAVSLETLYHAAVAHKAIGNCQQPLPVLNIVKSINLSIAKESNLQELFYALQGLTALGQKPADPVKLLKTIQNLLKKNDSLLNFGYYLHISGDLNSEAANSAFNRLEDILAQADEVDSKFLQFEGGLSTTALIVNGVFKVANVVNKAPPLTNEQAVKFANYFLSRSSVQTTKGIANLLNALTHLSSNKFQVPIAITLVSNPSLPVEKAKISIKVSDVLGNELGPVVVTADSATRINGDVVVASKKKLLPTQDKSVFTLDLSEGRPESGKYKVSLSASVNPSDARFPAAAHSIVYSNILTSVVIDFVDVGIVDADQTTHGKLIRVPFAKIADKIFEGDAQQKIQMRFTPKDKATGKQQAVHQAFVRFSRAGSQDSVIFIAEPDSNGLYRVELDIGSKAGDFGYISGEYNGDLIIGDALLANSFSWKFGRFNLKLSGEPKPAPDSSVYEARPEIKHLFREPESRPLKFVSDLFTLLAVLPLLILLVMWAQLRVNVSNFNLSIWSLTFHLGLGGIFLLFGLFWLNLNMFETVRYLLGIGLVTFFSGNRLLRNISDKKL